MWHDITFKEKIFKMDLNLNFSIVKKNYSVVNFMREKINFEKIYSVKIIK